MSTAIAIGAYELPDFVELNVRSCRNIFGDAPILIYCGAGGNASKIKEIADKFDCSFVYEDKNRGHFAGCILNAVCAVAFAKANNCDIGIKLNQRFVLLGADIPDRLEAVFSDPKIVLTMPTKMREETLHDGRSKFHAKFSYLPDCIAFRASAVNAQSIADGYAEQVRTSKNQADTMTEMFWARSVDGMFKGRFSPLPWLSEPTEPPIYLRKAQHTSSQYQQAAKELGMDGGEFPTEEWASILTSAYRPMPRA